MNLINYIKSLFPSFKKDKVLESCTLTIQGLKEYSLPSYENSEELLKIKGFSSKQMDAFIKEYSKNVAKVDEKSFIGNVKTSIENAITLLEHLQDIAKKDFSETEASLALTYKKSNILRLIQVAEFLSVYSRKLLNYIYVVESADFEGSPSLKEALTKVEIDFVEDNFYNFTIACRTINNANKNFDRAYKDIPEAVITDLSEVTLPETIGNAKLDPFMMNGFINVSVVWNPFYLIAMTISEYQATKFKSTQNEFNMLQLRMLNLEKLHNKEPDAALQKEIVYNQTRLNDLEYKIHKMKEDYNV